MYCFISIEQCCTIVLDIRMTATPSFLKCCCYLPPLTSLTTPPPFLVCSVIYSSTHSLNVSVSQRCPEVFSRYTPWVISFSPRLPLFLYTDWWLQTLHLQISLLSWEWFIQLHLHVSTSALNLPLHLLDIDLINIINLAPLIHFIQVLTISHLYHHINFQNSILATFQINFLLLLSF